MVAVWQPARSSSAFIRSLPQPPQSVSPWTIHGSADVVAFVLHQLGFGSLLLVPPTSQSLPRSPKIASLPSVRTTTLSIRQVPFGASEMQPGLDVRPSLASKLRKNWYFGIPFVSSVSALVPVQVWPLGVQDVQPQTEPSELNRIARRGSYSL